MEWADKGNVKQSIIGHRFRQLLNTASIKLTYSDRDTEEQILMD